MEDPSFPVTAERRYSGMTSADRALERYGRLIEAGIGVFGTQGYRTASIKALCQHAGLSERYFYESFASREELLSSVYDRLTTAMLQSVRAAVEAKEHPQAGPRAANCAVVDFMLGDPRHARIMLIEVVGVSPELEAKRHQALTTFADEAMTELLSLSGIDPHVAKKHPAELEDQSLVEVLDFARLAAVSVVGGVNNMLVDALHSGKVNSNAQGIIDVACQFLDYAVLSVRALREQ